jgi:spermidine/putrescine transport system substrate-binding protein
MYYIGYTSVISGGEDETIPNYLRYCYEDEEGVSYDLSYFFGRPLQISTSKDQLRRQLYAAYPTADVLERSVVMNSFDSDVNRHISEMWTNIRCFRW